MFGFNKIDAAEQYDLEHRIYGFYMKERKRAYEHKPLMEEKSYRNLSSKAELKRIRAKVQEHVKK